MGVVDAAREAMNIRKAVRTKAAFAMGESFERTRQRFAYRREEGEGEILRPEANVGCKRSPPSCQDSLTAGSRGELRVFAVREERLGKTGGAGRNRTDA